MINFLSLIADIISSKKDLKFIFKSKSAKKLYF